MKKLVVLLILGGLAFGAYRLWFRPVEKRACARMADLCGQKADEQAKCEADFADLKKNASPEVMSKLDHCLADAKSCVEGGGCMVGTGLNMAGDLMNQFMKGLGGAMAPQK